MAKRSRDWLDGTPPSDVEAEKALIGSLILDPSLIAECRKLVAPKHLHDPANVAVYEAVAELSDAGSPVDVVMLRDCLRRSGNWDAAGRAGGIAEFCTAVPYARHWRYYATIVLRCYAHRALASSSLDLARDAYLGTVSPADLCDKGRKLFNRMAAWLKEKGIV